MRLRLLGVALLAAMIAVACGGDGGGGAGGNGDEPPVRVAYASDLDPNDIADQFGLEQAGADVIELTEDSAVIAGLIRGDVDVGNIGLTEAIKAAQTGVPIKVFYVSQQRFEFVMVAQPGIDNFDKLAGKKVAYHAPGSGTEILQRLLVRQHDPALEDKIDWVVLPESPNRAAAMIAGEIDVTSLEFADVLTLQDEGAFELLGGWGDIEGESRDAVSTVWVTSEEYYNENKDRLQELATQLQEGYDRFYEDKEGWVSFAAERVEVDEARLAKTWEFYNEQEMYPTSGEVPLTAEHWESLDGFFREIGEYEDPASPDLVDFEMIEAANGT